MRSDNAGILNRFHKITKTRSNEQMRIGEMLAVKKKLFFWFPVIKFIYRKLDAISFWLLIPCLQQQLSKLNPKTFNLSSDLCFSSLTMHPIFVRDCFCLSSSKHRPWSSNIVMESCPPTLADIFKSRKHEKMFIYPVECTIFFCVASSVRKSRIAR